jgi:hypothetical protein
MPQSKRGPSSARQTAPRLARDDNLNQKAKTKFKSKNQNHDKNRTHTVIPTATKNLIEYSPAPAIP